MKLRLLQSFLHGYDDDDCIKILNKCKEAIPAKGGRLIIVEIVVDIDETLEFARSRLCMDLELVVFGGKERTKDEWKNLLTEAGFGNYKIIPMAINEAIIEAYP